MRLAIQAMVIRYAYWLSFEISDEKARRLAIAGNPSTETPESAHYASSPG